MADNDSLDASWITYLMPPRPLSDVSRGGTFFRAREVGLVVILKICKEVRDTTNM